jgi:hypothetical protein
VVYIYTYIYVYIHVFLNGGISNAKVTMIYDTQTTLVDMWNALSKSREFYVPYLLYVHFFFVPCSKVGLFSHQLGAGHRSIFVERQI